MPLKIPAAFVQLVQEMVQGTGLSEAVINAQVMQESGYNATALSPAGAEGWLQFLPSTYEQYGGVAGTEDNPADEATVYIRFMNSLLSQFGGNVRDALAAYNAGPGNIGAGLGYANTILANAGYDTSRVTPRPVNPSPVMSSQSGTPGQIAQPTGNTGTYTVKPGDSLSSIAAALNYPGGWQSLYASNRNVVGSNPNLIYAGQILKTPAVTTAAKPVASTPPSVGTGGIRITGTSAVSAPAAPAVGTPVLTSPVSATVVGGGSIKIVNT